MKKHLILILAIAIFISTNISTASAGWGWVVFHERAFKGKVVDAETGEPIEGAVVVAKYYKTDVNFWDWGTDVMDVQEAMSGSDGIFNVPSFTTLIHPFSYGTKSEFLIWKPGYVPLLVQDSYIFTREIGTIEGRMDYIKGRGMVSVPTKMGIAELRKAKTWKQRREAHIDAGIFDRNFEAKLKYYKKLSDEDAAISGPLFNFTEDEVDIPLTETPIKRRNK